MTVAIAGASGLTGGETLHLLLAHLLVEKVIAIGRSPLQIMHPKLEQVLLLQNRLNSPVKADAFICCLGTTIKKVGSKAAFEAVDRQLPVYLAGELHRQGCQTAAVVSAMGASASSFIFYNRIKGLMEDDMKAIGFQSLHLLHPSLIDGNRKEQRKGEQFAIHFFRITKPLFAGPLRRYRAIKAIAIAQCLVNCILQQEPGIHIYPSNQIETIAQT